ncbi:MAG TPA: sulfite exporter TauE/SafE family protein [Candidatus Binatia bacterium]
MDFALPSVGFLVGVLIGMTGMGGGALMTPILVLGFGISPSVAVGTDLIYAAVAKSAGVWVHHRHGTIRWKIVRLLAAGSVPSAILTVFLLAQIKSLGVNYDRFITLVLAVALILTSAVLVVKSLRRPAEKITGPSPMESRLRRHRKAFTVLAGVLVGVLVSLSSVGAGVLGVAMLLFLYPRLPVMSIAGTDLAYAVPVAAVAGLGHLQIGHVDYALLGALLVGALPGTYLGGRLGTRLPDRVVRPILAACLFAVGLRCAL